MHLPRLRRPSRTRTLAARSALVAASTLALGLRLTAPSADGAPPGNRATPTQEPGVTASLWEWNWNSIAASARVLAGRLRRGAGRSAAELGQADRARQRQQHRAAPLVGGLPAGDLRPDQPDGQRAAVQGHGQDLPAGGRQGLRRRGDQPHDRPGQHLLRRPGLHPVQLPGRAVRPGRLPLHTGECSSSDGGIQDFNNKNQVFKCNLVGLEDLDTDSDKVQAELAGYLNKLIRLRRLRLPGGRGQAHRPGRPGRHLLAAEQDQGRGQAVLGPRGVPGRTGHPRSACLHQVRRRAGPAGGRADPAVRSSPTPPSRWAAWPPWRCSAAGRA